MRPLISIIMPVYNSAKYLEETVTSILCQSFDAFELIMIDDGSKDSSGSICDRLASTDGRIRVIHQMNGGISRARNRGLDEACAEYITFCDHDDVVSPSWLQNLYDHIKDRDLVISGFCFVRRAEFSPEIFQQNISCDEEIDITNIDEMKDLFPRVDAVNNGSVWRQLFRRDIIVQNHLRFEQTEYEDLLFSYQYMLHIVSLRKISCKDYCHIINPESTGASHKYIAEYDWIVKMKQLHEEINRRFRINDSLYIHRLLGRYAVHCSSFLLKGYYPECRVTRTERFKRWEKIRGDSWFKSLSVRDMGGLRNRVVLMACRLRLYKWVDPLFAIMGKYI